MKIFSWVCALALVSAAKGENQNDLLSNGYDAENAEWFNRMAQEVGSMNPPPTTMQPTPSPTVPPPPTMQPTPSPTVLVPTTSPSMNPTKNPTTSPTKSPTILPSSFPSKKPTLAPTLSHRPSTSQTPTLDPSDIPSVEPTSIPTSGPTEAPTGLPSTEPSNRPSDTPTNSPTITPLEIVPRLGIFYLQRCQGDCNADTDCAFGLVCYQRDGGTSSVPGCSGDANQLGNGDEDYCVFPSSNQLVIVGDDINGVQTPPEVFPLGRCQGDCNNDDDCAGNLLCRQRDDNAAITGCTGGGAPGFDYCYSPGPDDLVLLGDDDDDVVVNLARCRGDCDEDTDCQVGLVCFQRDYEPRGVPGCNGDAFQIGNGDDDFCIQASANTLNFRGDGGQPASAFPLGNCQGDCDDDSECAGNLRCYQRDLYEDVPGCLGFGVSGYDYCSVQGNRDDTEPGVDPINMGIFNETEGEEVVETPAAEEEEEVKEIEKENSNQHRFYYLGGTRN